jgi:catalase
MVGNNTPILFFDVTDEVPALHPVAKRRGTNNLRDHDMQ